MQEKTSCHSRILVDQKQLILRCKRQDRKAQEELYRSYSAKLFVLCLKYSDSYEQAQDLLQDAFIKIFGKIEQFSGKGSFEGWMCRLVINTALKKSRKEGIFMAIHKDLPQEIEADIDDTELSLDFLIQIIQKLPEAYRLAFNLYVMEGLSHKEIARTLNISEGTSKSNLARARMKLRECINDHVNPKVAKSI